MNCQTYVTKVIALPQRYIYVTEIYCAVIVRKSIFCPKSVEFGEIRQYIYMRLLGSHLPQYHNAFNVEQISICG